ncbi:hypothetical protein ABZP36_004931 [Zizania latifolia]
MVSAMERKWGTAHLDDRCSSTVASLGVEVDLTLLSLALLGMYHSWLHGASRLILFQVAFVLLLLSDAMTGCPFSDAPFFNSIWDEHTVRVYVEIGPPHHD